MDVLRTAILDFCRRRENMPFSPAEVVRQMFPEDWELFMEEIREAMMQLYQEGLILVTLDGIPVDPFSIPKDSTLMISNPKPI